MHIPVYIHPLNTLDIHMHTYSMHICIYIYGPVSVIAPPDQVWSMDLTPRPPGGGRGLTYLLLLLLAYLLSYLVSYLLTVTPGSPLWWWKGAHLLSYLLNYLLSYLLSCLHADLLTYLPYLPPLPPIPLGGDRDHASRDHI